MFKISNVDIPDMTHSNSSITLWDTLIIVVLRIALPTWDVYSDFALSLKLLTSGYSELVIFGWLMLAPIFLSSILLIPQWWSLERPRKRLLVTLPLLLIQLWPQSCMIRLLCQAWWKKNHQWKEEKIVLECRVSQIGMYIGE